MQVMIYEHAKLMVEIRDGKKTLMILWERYDR